MIAAGLHGEARFARGQMQALRAHLRACLKTEAPGAPWFDVLTNAVAHVDQAIAAIDTAEAQQQTGGDGLSPGPSPPAGCRT